MIQATPFHKGAHLDASEVDSAIDACPICLTREARQPVFKIQDSPEINMLRCPRCYGCSASHMPKIAVLDRYYSQYYVDSQLKTTTYNTAYFARHVTGPMSAINRTGPIRILDFGGGNGSLAHAMAELILSSPDRAGRVEIDLVDYEDPGPFSSDRITVRGYRDLASVQGPYDVIVASAILEHIPRLNETVRGLIALARPGTYFYARTPFMIPLARLLGNLDLTYPAHVHDLGSSFWNRFPSTFDFKADIVVSRPSLIETTFAREPVRTVAAFLMKLPSYLELALRRRHPLPDTLWNLVGGWEVVLRFY